ncbi:MAG: 4-(cytidine 5'-diphospho)-2-C-methyl-D-erythritol kinase, partial [Oligoflexia bacterium]|nr:4-(cytidine 5'-diphospho)-2-C-methyl-D-erythritol kinase [Oligoflexia bacterium]
MKSPEIKEIKAPAKINLGLYITGKRPDGYHELASIFLPLELHDVIKVSATEVPGFEISVSGPFADQCPANNDNIIYRAYKLLCENCKIDQGVRVGLCKNIPAGAGLGGGSSDAAGFIVLMNDLLGLRMDNAALKNIAAKVGADVPFFIDCKPALVEGIGEIIRPFELKRDYWALIVKPREGLSTADVYKKYKFDLTLIDKSAKYLK